MIDIFLEIVLLLGILVAIGAFVEWIKLKKLLKEIRSYDPKHYRKIRYKVSIFEKEYYLNFFLLDPKTYEKIKSEPGTSVSFDIETSDIEIAIVYLMTKDQKFSVKESLYAYELRNNLSSKRLEFFENAQKIEATKELKEELAKDLEFGLKEKEILENYQKGL